MVQEKSADARQYPTSESQQALRQAIDLIEQATSLYLDISPDTMSFRSRPKVDGPFLGIQSISGSLLDQGVIRLEIELLRADQNVRVDASIFFKHLSALSRKSHLLPPPPNSQGTGSALWVELNVQATLLSVGRASVLLKELKDIDNLARCLQCELPAAHSNADLIKQYGDVAEFLAPVLPIDEKIPALAPGLPSWANAILDLLLGNLSVALVCPYPAPLQFSLSLLARTFSSVGRSLGVVTVPAVNSKGMIEISKKAPGYVCLEASRISLGISPYEIGNEIQNLVQVLASMHQPAIFTGAYGPLQAVFHGGQGGTSDPLLPVVQHVPPIPLEALLRFEIEQTGQGLGGLPRAGADRCFRHVHECLSDLAPADQIRVLPSLVAREVHIISTGKGTGLASSAAFARSIQSHTETLNGLSTERQNRRLPHIDARFHSRLSGESLFQMLNDHILAQPSALRQLAGRLRTEATVGSPHQPIVYCAQGTPATGKSESAKLIASYLEIPYVNVDAASYSDVRTAVDQLMGSGRGIVGSYQSGRLEQAAKHHQGVLIEVSDLDHSLPHIRPALADIFLQVLENGEAQSGTGAMFSCSNIIFAFTINLPGGLDETIRRKIGFNEGPSEADIREDVNREIKSMFSSAFLSRIGTPILFEPLTGDALAEIIERAIRISVVRASDRTHRRFSEIIIEPGTGAAIIENMKANILSYGARILLEQARQLTAGAILELEAGAGTACTGTLVVSTETGTTLHMHTQ